MTEVRGDLPEPAAPTAPREVPPVEGAPLAALDLKDVETDWRKLNVRMLLIHPVQEGIKFVPALIAVFFVGRNSEGGGGWWELAALAAVIVLGVMRYFTTRFRIENGQIELRKGLFNKQVIATPADRVRTVDVTAPIFHRILGLAKVEIGTAGTGKDRLVLDALTVQEARHLREELIHRRNVVTGAAEPAPAGAMGPAPGQPLPAGAVPGASMPSMSSDETTLLTFDPSWVRYAPLTMTGVLSALAILGFGNQFIQRYLQDSNIIGGQIDNLRTHPVWLDVVVGIVGLLIAVSVLAVIGYLLQFWGFRLTRHAGGTLHVTRGLVTTRETSIEEKRIRGVEIGEPLGLRFGGGGRLMAITTGLSKKEQDRGSAWLVPSAPQDVVSRVAAAIVGDDEALTAALVPHGPAARRRRYTRAIVPAVIFGLAFLALCLVADLPVWLAVLGFIPLVIAPSLAKDRYAGLGHYLTARHLVVRSGSFVRRRDLLLRHGVIGFNLRQTFFQRRVGVSTLAATTAAGKQSYTAYDIPLGEAVTLAHEVDPHLVEQFLAH